KDTLRQTGMPMNSASLAAQGNGLINLSTALSKTPTTTKQAFTLSTGTGTLESPRGDVHLVLSGVTLTGEKGHQRHGVQRRRDGHRRGRRHQLDRRDLERQTLGRLVLVRLLLGLGGLDRVRRGRRPVVRQVLGL